MAVTILVSSLVTHAHSEENTQGSSNFTNDEKKEQNKGPIRQNARRTTLPLSDIYIAVGSGLEIEII